MFKNRHIKIFIILPLLLAGLIAHTPLTAQDTTVNRVEILDSAFLNRDIFHLVTRQTDNSSAITIIQSPHIVSAMRNYTAASRSRRINGYRVRIFFDNRQDARVKSESIENSFRELYPQVGVYRTYTNPYFKVTVGDFRNRSDAMKFLKRIEGVYPFPFIVREPISFPPL